MRAPLGYSRRLFTRAYRNEQLAALLNAHERAFHHFRNLTEELLCDHPRTVVLKRDRQGQHIQ